MTNLATKFSFGPLLRFELRTSHDILYVLFDNVVNFFIS